MVTLKDVALRAGVSVASVSTVVNNTAAVSPAMRERVQKAVAELGYVPHVLARNLKLGRTSTIGLVIPDITNPHFSGLASAIEEACDEAGYTLTLCSTADDAGKEVRQLEALRHQRAAGVILVPVGSQLHPTGDGGRLFGGPTVLLDRVLAGFELDAVVLDNVEAGFLATEHLLRQGHRRIAMIAGLDTLDISRDRIAGFQRAFRSLDLDPAGAHVLDGGFQVTPSFEATLRLLVEDEPPTAVVTANSHATVGVMRALAEHGLRSPDDMSVVGIDDFAWADAFQPRLTAVSQPIVDMGRTAVGLLLARIGAPAATPASRVVLRPTLIVRGSTRVCDSPTPNGRRVAHDPQAADAGRRRGGSRPKAPAGRDGHPAQPATDGQ